MSPDETLDDLIEDFTARFSLNNFRGEAIVRYFRACDMEIRWLRQLDKDGYIWGMVLKPQSVSLTETYGLLREIPVIVSRHAEFQPRLLMQRDAIAHALSVRGRLQDDICIVFSDDPLLDERLTPHENDGMVWLPLSTRVVESHLASGAPSLRFRELLQQHLYARDFFDRADPVVGADYFGRAKLLQDLSSQLLRGAHVGLYGLRKVGKTSLIKRLVQQSKLAAVQVARCVHIDLLATPSGSRNQTFLLHAIAEAIVKEQIVEAPDAKRYTVLSIGKLPPYHRLADPKTQQTFHAQLNDDLRLLLKTLTERGQRLVVILDEIEQLFPIAGASGYDGYNDFLSYLRGLSQQLGALSLLVVGVNPNVSEAQLLGTSPNPVFGFFSARYVTPLSPDDTRDMIKGLGRKSGVDFTHDAIQLLYTWLGGHPFLTRRYCSLVLEGQARPFNADTQAVERVREGFVRRENSHFAEMVSVVRQYYPNEFELLHRIACSDSGIQQDKVGRQGLSHLEGYQLVDVVDNCVRLRNHLIREWLLGISKASAELLSGNAFASGISAPVNSDTQEALGATLSRVELAVRQLIRRTLDQRWGGKADARIRASIGADAFTDAEARMAKSLRSSGQVQATEILDFLYLDQLKSIIVGNEWQEFRVVFEDKREIERNINALSAVRNEIAHYRAVPHKEATRAQLAADDIMEKMNAAGG